MTVVWPVTSLLGATPNSNTIPQQQIWDKILCLLIYGSPCRSFLRQLKDVFQPHLWSDRILIGILTGESGDQCWLKITNLLFKCLQHCSLQKIIGSIRDMLVSNFSQSGSKVELWLCYPVTKTAFRLCWSSGASAEGRRRATDRPLQLCQGEWHHIHRKWSPDPSGPQTGVQWH